MHPFSLLSLGTPVHCPLSSPTSYHLSWKDLLFLLFSFFSVLLGWVFYKEALIHPPPKSSTARDSRAALLPDLLVLCGQGQRGCGLLLHHFLKEKRWRENYYYHHHLWFYLHHLIMTGTTAPILTTITTANTPRLLLVPSHQLELSPMDLKSVFQTFSIS